MLDTNTINRIRLLRRKGHSYKSISRWLSVSVGSVYSHSVDIGLTKIQKNRLLLKTAIGASLLKKKEWGKKGGLMTGNRSKYTKLSLIRLVQSFYLIKSRIPLKREFNTYWQSIRKKFGKWNILITESGYKPNDSIFTHKFYANDGHICDSLSEKIIDDHLFSREIYHIRNVPYYPKCKYKADFLIGDKFVEYFGLRNQLQEYDKKVLIKIKLAKRLGIELVSLYPEDLKDMTRIDKKIYSS